MDANDPLDPATERPLRTKANEIRYFLGSLLLWVVVDLGTAGGFRLSYIQKFGPVLLFFYIGYPLVFTFLVFRAKLSDLMLLASTMAAIFVIEVLFTQNPLLMGFPALLAGIPLAAAVYAPLTFFPLWWIRGELGKRKLTVIALCFVEVLITFLTIAGGPK